MNRLFAIFGATFFLLSAAPAIPAGDLTTAGDCSPLVYSSTVNSISVDCAQDHAQLDKIARAVAEVQVDSHLNAAQTERLVFGIDVIVKALLDKEAGLYRSAAQTNSSLTRVLAVLSDLRANPASESDSVVATEQSGGVAAGHIGTLNQTNITPYMEQQSKHSATLQTFVAAGEEIREALLPSDITDGQIDSLSNRRNAWVAEVAAWLNANMGPAARSSFLNVNGSAMSFQLTGSHDPTKQNLYNTMRVEIPALLHNLGGLIETTAYDCNALTSGQ